MDQHTSPQLIIGTSNPGKIQEITAALQGLRLVLRTLGEFTGLSAADESGSSYEENALIKAKHYARQTGLCTLADDSGLEVEALGGRPGVLSARYGEKDASDEERVSLLLSELSGVENRRARFVCVMAIAEPSIIKIACGTCEGKIAQAPKGRNGFGYDPVFIPDGYNQTFGELPAEIKSVISHRGQAIATVKEFLDLHLALTAGVPAS